MTFYAPFCLPFIIGAAVMFAVLAWKWGTWLYRLPRADKKRILFGLPTRRPFGAGGGGGGGAGAPPPPPPQHPPALSEAGKIVEQCIFEIPTHYPHISVEKYAVMPNHVHLLLLVQNGQGGRPQ